MKRLLMSAAAALAFVTPLAAASAQADPRDRYERRDDRREWRDDRRDDRRDWRDDRREWRDDRRHYRDGYREGRRDDWRDDRRAYRQGYRDGHWDDRRYNGYHYRDRFYYGRPPVHYYSDHSYRPEYRAWRRGDYLPPYYRERYVVVDYHRHRHLYAPPRGAHWVRDDRGDYLLVGVATGLILGLALGN